MATTLINNVSKTPVNCNDHLSGNPFLLNCWYVGAWKHEVEGDTILARQLLSKRVIFFRDSAGDVSALEDRCSHRFAPLSIGRHTGDGVRCMYHGLVFNGKGACIEEPGVKGVSRGTDIQSYPVAEKDGFIWIWMGDPALAKTDLIPDCSYQSQPGKWDWEPRYRYFNADYRLIADNLLDFSHLTFVHENTLGGSAKIADIKPKTEMYEKGVRISRWYMDEEKIAPYLRGFETFEGRVDRWNIYDLETKGNIFNMDSGSAPAGSGAQDGNFVPKAMLFHATQIITPETETSSHFFWSYAHNFNLGDPKFTTMLTDRIAEGFEEDKEMIEAQQVIVSENPDIPFAYIHFDRGVSAGRKALAKALAEEADYFTGQKQAAE